MTYWIRKIGIRHWRNSCKYKVECGDISCYLRCGRITMAAQGRDRSVMDTFCSSGSWISDSTSSGTAGCSVVLLVWLLLNTLWEEGNIRYDQRLLEAVCKFKNNWRRWHSMGCIIWFVGMILSNLTPSSVLWTTADRSQRPWSRLLGVALWRGSGWLAHPSHSDATGNHHTWITQLWSATGWGGKAKEEREGGTFIRDGTELKWGKIPTHHTTNNSPAQTASWWTSPLWTRVSDLGPLSCQIPWRIKSNKNKTITS